MMQYMPENQPKLIVFFRLHQGPPPHIPRKKTQESWLFSEFRNRYVLFFYLKNNSKEIQRILRGWAYNVHISIYAVMCVECAYTSLGFKKKLFNSFYVNY